MTSHQFARFLLEHTEDLPIVVAQVEKYKGEDEAEMPMATPHVSIEENEELGARFLLITYQ